MSLTLTCIEAHAEGEPGRVIVDADALVPGDTMNLKVTYPADLAVAAMILRGRK